MYFYIFQRLIHIFKDDFTKFQYNSRTKGTFFKFEAFSRTKVKFFQVCANSVRACLILYAILNPQIHFVDICCGHGMSLSVFIH